MVVAKGAAEESVCLQGSKQVEKRRLGTWKVI
jgi:hypothetical protein